MRRPDVTLRGFLTQAGDLTQSMLHGVRRSVPLQGAARSTRFGDLDSFRDRSVLIATRGQLETVLALIDLDGVARRILLCPPGIAREHLSEMLRKAEVDTIVCDDRAEYAQFHLRCVELAAPAERMSDASHERYTEWVLTTSGTTGTPKLVAHTLAGLTGAIGAPGSRDHATVWATFYDIRRYGGLQIFLRAIVGGTSMVLSDAEEPLDSHLYRLARCGVTHISGTPSHWRRVLMSPEHKLFHPQYVRLSGEIADQAVLNALKEAFHPADVSHAYASTEAGVAFNVTDGREGFPATFIADCTGSGVEMKIVDGSLRIRSPRIAIGYIGSTEPLHDADGFVDTGDMVELSGERYCFVGRRGGIINVGGLKVHPEEVEAVINTHPLVRMSRVSARKNPITGALVQAEIVLNDEAGHAENLAQEITALCRQKLSPHKVPARIATVQNLAVTSGGKLARPNG
jgi:acyl-coenzyme A synthetase/AMP-(fatty) acid ligase